MNEISVWKYDGHFLLDADQMKCLCIFVNFLHISSLIES